MLLRRITEHIKEQNWFAVLIDFAIVVFGVFIGIQVANWNEVQSNKAGLSASLQRLDIEVSQNLELIEAVLEYYEAGRSDFVKGREALNDCTNTVEGQAALERLLFDFVQDVQPNFVTVALDQLAKEGRHQDLLSSKFQQDFGEYAGRLQEEEKQLTSHYENMWSHHVNQHPSVTAYFPSDNERSDGGWSFKLDKTFDEVCADASFRNRFINTIGFYSSINTRLAELKSEIQRFQISLTEEMERR